MKHIVRIIIIAFSLIISVSCDDELVREQPAGDGMARISASLDFKPMSAALARSRSDGGALKDIKSLHVLLYDSETKELKGKWEITGYKEADMPREDADAEYGDCAEAETKNATFTLPEDVRFGTYYMYAVANIPDLFDKYSNDIQTVDELKAIPLEWNPEDISANGQMLGCFTKGDDASLPSISDVPVVIDGNNVSVHAWLRRAASKVTVAFDGSGLKEGVSIFIKELRIKNIPARCSLGNDNKADEDNIIETGETVTYSTSAGYDPDVVISKSQPFYPRIQQMDESENLVWIKDPDSHSEDNPNSLFFYENMQGEGPDKRQDHNNDGIRDELFPYKDKPYATYIEVDAYYESTVPERLGICNITYRFMLGQDIKKDYNAKRNGHYKLTLRFKNYADEPDWRIDYVTRLSVTEPKVVDYRGKYFVPEGVPNEGNTFSDNNVITVTSFMFDKDNEYLRNGVDYKVEFKEHGSSEFSSECPDWFSMKKNDKGNGIYEEKISYANTPEPFNVNAHLGSNSAKVNHDLSTNGGTTLRNTANCYIADALGSYRFPLAYGNAIVDGGTNASAYTHSGGTQGGEEHYLKTFLNYLGKPITEPYIKDDVAEYGMAPAGVKLVWQDEQGLITNLGIDMTLYDNKGGITFSVSKAQEGNAIIAVLDGGGTVMWSWHIWVTSIDFTNNVILNRPYVELDAWTILQDKNFEIMPVNLGWCSGGTDLLYYDRRECDVRFTQLINKPGEDEQEGMSMTVKVVQMPHIAVPCGNNPLYQWGRKDPFISGGSANSTDKPRYDVNGNLISGIPLMHGSDPNGSRNQTWELTADLIKNPDTWQNCPHVPSAPGSKIYKPQDNIYLNLWDNSCWDGTFDDIVKTIYDPCPVGYHVSPMYMMTGLTTSGTDIGNNWGYTDLSTTMYAATEDNMFPEGTGYDRNKYTSRIFEFYTDRTKLMSIGFPQNGYRDWDDNAGFLKFDDDIASGSVDEGHLWFAQGAAYANDDSYYYNAYYFEYTRNARTPHIWPWKPFYSTDGFAVRPTKVLSN